MRDAQAALARDVWVYPAGSGAPVGPEALLAAAAEALPELESAKD